MQAHHVYIALREQDISAFGLFRQIEREEVAALVENGRFRAVEVFRSVLAEDAARKADHVAAHVDHREHEPVAEGVVPAAVPALFDQSRVEELIVRIALFAHRLFQRAPFVRRAAETEIRGRRLRDAAPRHVFPGALARGGVQLLVEKAGCVPVEREQTGALFALAGVLLLGQGHVRPPREKGHRLREGEVFDLHDEADHAAALAAAEAVVDLLVRRDGERGRFLAVEGAEPEHVRPALLPQTHVARDDVDDVVARDQFVYESVRECRLESPPRRLVFSFWFLDFRGRGAARIADPHQSA